MFALKYEEDESMHSDFTYQPVYDGAGCQLAVTILGDRAAVRDEMQDDALAAGFRVLECCSLEEFASGSSEALGDLVLVDCVATDAATTINVKICNPQ